MIGKLGIEEKNKSRRGTLGLDIESLKTIRNYFNKIKRKPSDVEIETLAQTWSEHCKHKIFSSKIDNEIRDKFPILLSLNSMKPSERWA